jgi:hypothetical protein
VDREQEANQGTVVQADICRHIRCYRAPRELGRIERRRFARRRDDVGRPLHGNRLELPWFAGKVVELGRRHGFSDGGKRLHHAALKPYVSGTPT